MYSVGISTVSFYGSNVCLEINELIGTSAVFLPLKTNFRVVTYNRTSASFKYLKITVLWDATP
jgi:hypothetical protein